LRARAGTRRLAVMAALALLAAPRPAQETSQLLTLLESSNADSRQVAARMLAEHGSPALPGLHVALKDGDWRVRAEAARSLGTIASRDSLEALAEACADRNETVQARATFALGELGAPALRSLLDMHLAEPNQTSSLSLMSLARVANAAGDLPPINEELFDVLTDKGTKASDRSAAAWVLSRSPPRVLSHFRAALRRDKPAVRERALWGLAQSRVANGDAVELLRKYIDDSERSVRERAAWALGYRRDDSVESLDALEQFLAAETKSEVRAGVWALAQAGRAGLERLLRRSMSDDLPRWSWQAVDTRAPALLESLAAIAVEAEDDETALAALELLEFLRCEDAPTMRAILPLTAHANASVRAQALTLLNQCANPGRQAGDVFLQALDDPEAVVRKAAAAGCQKLAPSPELAVSLLLDLLREDPSSEVRALAAWALGSYGAEADVARAHLLAEVRGENPVRAELATLALTALGAAVAPGAEARAAVDAWMPWLDRVDCNWWFQVVDGLSTLGSAPVADLEQRLSSGRNPVIRRRAVLALAGTGEAGRACLERSLAQLSAEETLVALSSVEFSSAGVDAVLPVLLERLRNESGADDEVSARSIACLGPRARAAVGPLASYLTEAADEPGRCAVLALAAIGAEDPAALRTLTDLVLGATPLAAPAARALGSLGPAAASAADALARQLVDEEAPGRAEIARALGEIGAGTEEVRDVLLDVLKDGLGSPVSVEAARSLEKIAGADPEVLAAIGKRIAAADTDLRIVAAGALARVGSEAYEELGQLLYRMMWSRDVRERRAAVRALGAMGSEAVDSVPALIWGFEYREEERPSQVDDLFSSLGGVPRAEESDDREPVPTGELPELAAVYRRVPREFFTQCDETWLELRVECARALESIGPRAALAVPALLRAASDPDERIRSAADQAFNAIR